MTVMPLVPPALPDAVLSVLPYASLHVLPYASLHVFPHASLHVLPRAFLPAPLPMSPCMFPKFSSSQDLNCFPSYHFSAAP